MTTNQEELKFMSEFLSLLKIQENSFRPLNLGNKDNSSKKNTHTTQKSLLSKLDTITRLIMLDIENGCEYNKHTSNKTMLFFRHIVKAIYSVFVHTKAFEVESLFGNIHEYDTYEDMPLTQQVALRKTQKSFSFENKKS